MKPATSPNDVTNGRCRTDHEDNKVREEYEDELQLDLGFQSPTNHERKGAILLAYNANDSLETLNEKNSQLQCGSSMVPAIVQ